MLKLLILFPRTAWDRSTNMTPRQLVENLQQREDLDVRVSGQGWPDYSDEHSLHWNIRRIHPDAQLVFWHKPLGMPNVPALKHPGNRDIPAVEICTAAWYPDNRTYKAAMTTKVDLVLCHHQFDMPKLHHKGTGPPVAWLPAAADRTLYASKSRPWNARQIQCALVGNCDGEQYPLRAKFRQILRDGAVHGVIREHPGDWQVDHPACLKQINEYAALLANTKLVLMCSSKHSYGLQKYAEAAMAGACIMGDVPDDYRDTLGPHIIEVNPRTSPDKLRNQIQHALADQKLLSSRAALAQSIAMRMHSLDRYATQFVYNLQLLLESLTGKTA